MTRAGGTTADAAAGRDARRADAGLLRGRPRATRRGGRAGGMALCPWRCHRPTRRGNDLGRWLARAAARGGRAHLPGSSRVGRGPRNTTGSMSRARAKGRGRAAARVAPDVGAPSSAARGARRKRVPSLASAGASRDGEWRGHGGNASPPFSDTRARTSISRRPARGGGAAPRPLAGAGAREAHLSRAFGGGRGRVPRTLPAECWRARGVRGDRDRWSASAEGRGGASTARYDGSASPLTTPGKAGRALWQKTWAKKGGTRENFDGAQTGGDTGSERFLNFAEFRNV